MNDYTITPIARIRSDFPEKFGIPRQSGVVESLTARIVFEPAYRNADALRGLEGFSHIWLIWQFSANLRENWRPTVRPPRLGGNERMGVFATRSPFRPNALGLSCVKLLGIEPSADGPVLTVAGADLMDGTPIFDIKPYLPYADCIPDATGGFAPDSGAKLAVTIPETLLQKVPADKREALRGVLENDPRPRYQDDSARVYKLDFASLHVEFQVDGRDLRVTDIRTLPHTGD